MILTLTSSKSPVYIRELDVVKPHPSGGCTIWTGAERFQVVQGFDTIMAMMAQPNTPSQPTPAPTPTPTPAQQRSNMAMTLVVLNQEVEIDPATDQSLVHKVHRSTECMVIIEHWFRLYHDRMGSYPPVISAKNLGTIYGCANRGDTDKAIKVLTWQYTSSHYRAKYFQNQGMLDPAVTIKQSSIVGNFSMAMQAEAEKEAPALVPISDTQFDEDRFDKQGNLL